MIKIRIVSTKEFSMFIEVGGQTKTIPAKCYLIVTVSNDELSALKGKYRDSLKFIEVK